MRKTLVNSLAILLTIASFGYAKVNITAVAAATTIAVNVVELPLVIGQAKKTIRAAREKTKKAAQAVVHRVKK